MECGTVTSVLYDVPGPKSRARNRVIGVITIIMVVAILGYIVVKFWETGQFSAQKWSFFSFPLVEQGIIQATGRTLHAFALGAVLSLILGLILALGRLSDHAWLRIPCTAFIEFFRAVPLLIVMMIMYYGLPPMGLTFVTPLVAVVTGLTLYNGSVLAEVFRAGVRSLPRGQSESAYAIGLRKYQVMSMILLPQATRAMLPVIISQLVVILKDTALGFIVTYQELLYLAKLYGSNLQYGSPIIPVTIVVGGIYIGLCLVLSGIANLIERRLKRRGNPTRVVPADIPWVPARSSL